MSSLVVCDTCGETVPAVSARRELTVWARSGKRGTLSSVKEPSATGRWRCDRCQARRDASVMQGQESLL